MKVYATRALVETCCRLAADADGGATGANAAGTDPEPVNVSLATHTPDELEPADGEGTPLGELDPETEIFAEFYFPGVGESLSAVFGMDLATPAGTDGRFLSHPDGLPEVSVTDDLHVRILVAVPPYGPENVRVYDRSGRQLDLELVAARSKDEAFDT